MYKMYLIRQGPRVELRSYYDAYWSDKDDSFDRSRLALLTDRIPSGAHVLEVGCGPGILGALLHEKDVKVTGLDFSPVALKRAHEKGVRTVLCDPDGEAFPFEDGAFEWAASNSSLEHLFLPEAALKEIHRVLAPGGTFLWMVPNVGHWRFRLWLLAGRFPAVENSPTDLLHLRMYTKKDAADLLRRIGFRIRGIAGSAGTWVPRLYPGLFRVPGIRHAYEAVAPLWPSLLCRYLVLEASKIA